MTAPDLVSTTAIFWNHWYNRINMSCTIQWPTSVTYSQQRWTTYLQKDIELVEKKLPKPSGNGKHEKNLEVYIHHLFILWMESYGCDATTHIYTQTHTHAYLVDLLFIYVIILWEISVHLLFLLYIWVLYACLSNWHVNLCNWYVFCCKKVPRESSLVVQSVFCLWCSLI